MTPWWATAAATGFLAAFAGRAVWHVRWLRYSGPQVEAVLLALMAYRPGGWTAYDLRAHVRCSWGVLYFTLHRLQTEGRVRCVRGPVDGRAARAVYDVVPERAR